MYVQDYEWYIRHLTEHVNMKPSDVLFVDSVALWCRDHGLEEDDERRPLKLLTGNGDGLQMLIAREITEEMLEERINALRIRNQLRNVSEDRSDRLNSATKKIAFLFLKEISLSIPGLVYDELAGDAWVFEQMERIGMFNP